MIDDIMMQAEERMEKALGSLGDAFASVRTGRANAMVLDRIRVDYYGVPTPVNQMAGVKTPDAHMLVIEPWDKGVLGAIERAVKEDSLPEDDERRGQAEVQKLTDKYIAEVDEAFKKKEAEVMEI